MREVYIPDAADLTHSLPGTVLTSVAQRCLLYSPEALADAIIHSKDETKGIELLVIDTDYYKTCNVDYHGGDRYPHLVRDESKPDYLDEIVKSEAGTQ